MSQILYINEARRDEILVDAASKQLPVVLTRRATTGWLTAKTRFSGLNEPNGQLFIECPPELDNRAWPQPTAGELLGVTFRRGHKKCLFNAEVVEAATPPSSEPAGEGFAVRWPADMQELQRRVYQRACPPPARLVKVGITPAGGRHGRPATITGIMEDLSAGGIRVRCARDPGLTPGQDTRLTFGLGARGTQMDVDATFRHCEEAAHGHRSLGFQFVGLETSRDGQELLVRLSRIVTDFQRAAARRKPGRLRSRRPAR